MALSIGQLWLMEQWQWCRFSILLCSMILLLMWRSVRFLRSFKIYYFEQVITFSWLKSKKIYKKLSSEKLFSVFYFPRWPLLLVSNIFFQTFFMHMPETVFSHLHSFLPKKKHWICNPLFFTNWILKIFSCKYAEICIAFYA